MTTEAHSTSTLDNVGTTFHKEAVYVIDCKIFMMLILSQTYSLKGFDENWSGQNL